MADFIKTSDLRERIEFVATVNEVDDYGEALEEERTVHTSWASVKSLMLKDVVASVGTVLEGTTTFIVRYRQPVELTTDLKIKWKNKQYKVVDINEGVFKQDFTTIIAKEF